MSRNKRPNGANDIYNDHLSSTPMFNEAQQLQQQYFNDLKELQCNLYEWVNIPDEIPENYLELILFSQGSALFFKEENYGKFFVTKGVSNGRLDMYDNPTAWRILTNGSTPAGFKQEYAAVPRTVLNKYTQERTRLLPEVVPIYSSYLRRSDVAKTWYYAKRLAQIDTTLGINTKSARRTRVVAVPENLRLSADTIADMIDRGEASISVSDDFDIEVAFQTIDFGIHPDMLNNLHIYRTRLWSECMGALGIDNANQDKKERLVANEVDANNQQVAAMRAARLNSRRKAAKQINDIWGLDLSVQFRTDAEGEIAFKEAEPERDDDGRDDAGVA